MKEHDSHLTHYIFLVLGLIVLGGLFVLFRYNPTLQILIGGVGTVFYIIWGILHHALEDRVTGLVVVEYVVFGTLAFLLMVLFVTV